MSLADDLRRRRETWIKAGGFDFCIRRPRDLDLVQWRHQGGNAMVAIHSVCDWKGVTVGDLTGMQDDEPQPFSTELAEEWLGDRLDLLVPIWQEVDSLVAEHRTRREQAEKN